MIPRKLSKIAAYVLVVLAFVQQQAVYAQPVDSDVGDYNSPSSGEPAFQSAPRSGSRSSPDAGRDTNTPRARLREELTRIKPRPQAAIAPAQFEPPLPVRRKEKAQPVSTAANPGATPPVNLPVSAEINRSLSDMLIFRFAGKLPTDEEPKAIRALLQSGGIAGVLIGPENIVAKPQARELMKSLAEPQTRLRSLIAAQDVGGAQSLLAAEKGFPSVPAQRDVAAKGDPNYSYLAYQTLGSHLAGLGFNLNFGPWLGTAKSAPESFGNDALQVSVFAKTFILAHRESGIIPVPILDMDDPRTLTIKALLVSFPDTPMSDMPSRTGADGKAFPQSLDDKRGPRFCFLAQPDQLRTIAEDIKRGCEAFVVNFKGVSPVMARQAILQSVAGAVANGEITAQQLATAAQFVNALRAGLGSGRSSRTN